MTSVAGGFNLPSSAISAEGSGPTFVVMQVNPFGDAALGPISSAGIILRILGPVLVAPVFVYFAVGYNKYEKRAGHKATVLGYLNFLATGYHTWSRNPLPDVAVQTTESRFRVERKSHMPLLNERSQLQIEEDEMRAAEKEKRAEEGFDIEAQHKRGRRKTARSHRALHKAEEVPPVPALALSEAGNLPAYRQPSPVGRARDGASRDNSPNPPLDRMNSCISQDGKATLFVTSHVRPKPAIVSHPRPPRRPKRPDEDVQVDEGVGRQE